MKKKIVMWVTEEQKQILDKESERVAVPVSNLIKIKLFGDNPKI
jgi:hypothetical protein